MYKLYSIAKNNLGKAQACGFWKDESGKIYIDKILPKYLNYNDFKIEREKLFASGEKAIFYVLEFTYKNNFAYIEYENGKADILKNCITWKEKKLSAKFIKELLKNHNGITIFKDLEGWKIEIWKA